MNNDDDTMRIEWLAKDHNYIIPEEAYWPRSGATPDQFRSFLDWCMDGNNPMHWVCETT